MRKFIIASISLASMTGIAYGGSFIVLDQAPSQDSAIVAPDTNTIFELYGPSANDCQKVSCPSQDELERLAKKGTTVMKVSGGDIMVLDNVFAPVPKANGEKAVEDEIIVISADEAIMGTENDLTVETAAMSQDGLPDTFKTGPLPNGEIQADVAGVDTEYLPDLEPEFEPEFTASIDDPAIVLENVSASSMEALSGAM